MDVLLECYITGGTSLSRCLVQYWFESGIEHEVVVRPHGNSRRKRLPFCRTMPSTLLSLKEEAQAHPPKAAIDVVYSENGGIMKAASVGQLPRNHQQVSNLRRDVAAKSNLRLCSAKGVRDPLFMVMEQSKLCKSQEKFVRIVTASPEPMSVLATDLQLHDLVRFATNPSKHCIVSIDPTFSLGDFSVTCLSYRNLLVTDPRTGECPILLGPLLVHQRKLFETYHFFAASLVSLCPSLSNLLAFGTDGEETLVKAFSQQFPRAVHLRCFRHMKGNISRKLTVDLKLPESVAASFMVDIFGCKVGPTFHEGLVDSISEDDFFANLASVKDKWQKLQDEHNSTGVSFYEWFLQYHAEVVMKTMLKPVRESVGLGDPPAEFNTNDSESTNSSVKQFLGFKKSDWPVFNEKIQKFIHMQQEEVNKSLVNLGQYVLKPGYQHLAVAPRKWFTSFTEKQKAGARHKFHNASVEDVHVPTSPMEPSIDIDPESDNKAAGKVDQPPYMGISVNVESASNITQLPALTLRQMWGKASDLLSTTGQISPAPGCSPKARMVASFSQDKPHYISVTSDGRFECDDKCPAFKQRRICSHCVATAEDNNMLKEFLDNYAKYSATPKGQQSVKPNFTRLSMTSLPSHGAGRKGDKPPKKKAISRRECVPEEQRRPFPASDQYSFTHCSGAWNSGSVLNICTSPPQNWMPPSYPPPSYAPPSYAPPSYPPPTWEWPTPPPMHPYYSTNPLGDITNLGGSSSGSVAPYGSIAHNTNPQKDVDDPFVINFLNRRIKVCAGCKSAHPKDPEGNNLPPPNDLCVLHRQSISFTNPKTGKEQSKLGNIYYHVSIHCIRKKYPHFTAAMVTCPDEVRANLQASHYQLLEHSLGLKLAATS